MRHKQNKSDKSHEPKYSAFADTKGKGVNKKLIQIEAAVDLSTKCELKVIRYLLRTFKDHVTNIPGHDTS